MGDFFLGMLVGAVLGIIGTWVAMGAGDDDSTGRPM